MNLHSYSLPTLVDALEARGVTVTDAGAYRAALAALEVPRDPQMPPDVLHMAPDVLAAHLRARAAHLVLTREQARLVRPVLDRLHDEMVAAMRPHVDEYLDVLRPRFHAAAGTARAVLAAGVKPGFTAQEIMFLGAPAAIAWHNFRESDALRVLFDVTSIRVALARALDVAEGRGDPALGITYPYVPQGLDPAHPFEKPHDRWLDLAPSLDLVPVAELDPEDVHTARGGTPYAQVRRLLDARDRRAAAGAEDKPASVDA